ncbi:MAG: hypothetical protein A3A88_00390 [Nitrospirae bacterium RIFCSPLOWO2_01_FULL_62_17]|nr:MAG: hypothetical protein A3A88_00390 [Nitrospirae bacterium RIFCSPLOWO2_01_FULL_62_17]
MQLAILSTANGNYRTEPFPVHLVSTKQDKGPIEQSPGYADYAQGLLYGKQEHYDQAIAAFNKAEAKGFKTFELFLLRGQAYLELKRYEEAQTNILQAIAMQPQNPHGYSLMAMVHQGTEQWEKAVEALSKGIAAVPKRAAGELYQARGIANIRLNKQEQAIKDLSQALRLGRTAPVVYYKRGRAFAELGRYKEAIDDFSEALNKQKNHHRSLLNRGWVYGCIGEFKKSSRDFDQLLSENQEDALVHSLRGWVRLESDDVDGGLSDLIYASEHGHSDPLTYLNLASAFYIKGALDKALEENAKAFALQDSESEAAISFQKGLLLLVSDKEREAKISYDHARGVALKFANRIELQEALADLQDAMNVHKEIKDSAQEIVKALEEAVSKTPKQEFSAKRCQQLRTRQE